MNLFWKITLFLLSANFFFENMGVFTHHLNLTFGLLLLSSLILLYLPIHIKPKFKTLFGLAFIVIGTALIPSDPISRGVGLTLFLLGFDQILKSSGREERELLPFLFTSGGYTFFLLFFEYTTFLWSFLQTLSLSFSNFLGILFQRKILISTTFIGLPSLLLFLLFLGTSSLHWKMKVSENKARGWGFLIGSLIGVQILSLFLHSFFTGISLEKTQIFIHERILLNSPFLYTILLLLPLYLYLRFFQEPALKSFASPRMTGTSEIVSSPAMKTKKNRALLKVLSILILIPSLGLLTLMPPRKIMEKGDIVFYEKGFLDWRIPTFEDFGEESIGMFGNLPLFVESMGFSSLRVSEITRESLHGAKILVLINLTNPFNPGETDAIWEFVREGGSLLILGDHTPKQRDEIWLNEALKPAKIRFNFDSAEFFIGGWLHSYEYLQHPLTVNLGDEQNEPGLVVGASLEVSYPAFSLVIGKYGFSDDANPEDAAGGYLGDLFYSPGEQLGDVILVAEQPYGKGRVLVFGDTSPFANSIMVSTHPIVNRVFTYLSFHPQTRASPFRFGIAFTGFLLVSFIFWKAGRSPLILLLFLSLALLFHHLGRSQRLHEIEKPLTGEIAYVDGSHNGRFAMDSWRDRGLMGLHMNLMRNGYLSFNLHKFSQEKLSQCDLLVLIAPSQPFSSKEIHWIMEYLERGGDLILTVGWEEKEAALPLLKALGMDIENIPMGNFDAPILGTEEKASFLEGWVLSFQEEETQVLSKYLGYPVILKRKVGAGDVVLIGDSSIFANMNLEHGDHEHPESVSFLIWLISLLRST